MKIDDSKMSTEKWQLKMKIDSWKLTIENCQLKIDRRKLTIENSQLAMQKA